MYKKLMGALHVFICLLLVVQLTGCGTLMYPERRGQKAGHIDVGVAVLDGIGLLFFLLPGVIAFAVDFSNGTIYLPGTSLSSLDIQSIKQVRFDPKHTTASDIERMIKEQTGQTIKWDQPDMQISKLSSTNDMLAQFAQALPHMQDGQIALNHLTGERP